MDDQSWQGLDEQWQRLRWARARKFDTAVAAAESMNMKPGTYQGHERNPGSSRSVPLDDQLAIKYGRKFGVRWEWLLLGTGSPLKAEPEPTDPMKRTLRVMGAVPLAQQEVIAAAIEALVKTGTGS